MFLILLLTFGTTFCYSSDSWTITNAVTTVWIAPENVKIVSNLKLTSLEPADTIRFAVYDENVASISASSGNQPLVMRKLQDQLHATWEIDLLKVASAAEISVTYFHTALVRLSTMEDENHTWEFRGNVNVFSPYVAQKQETIIQAGGKKLQFDPAFNVAPLTSRYEAVRFRDSSPVAHVPKAVREIFISNWGKIHVRDLVTLENRAPVSKKAFSRLNIPKNAIRDWTAYLPKESENIYYGDELGVIHSYSTRLGKDDVQVKLQARYPILAGWKTEYRLNYDLPAHEYLATNGTQFCLDMNFMDPLFEPLLIDDLILKITLPEKSQFTGETVPHGFSQLPNEWQHATLDTFGRMVLVFNKKNIVEGANNFHICYTNELNSFARVGMNGIRASFYIFTLLLVFGSLYRMNEPA